MNKTKINLAVCLDNNYVLPTTVLLNSIGYNKGDEDIDVYAISEHPLSEKTIKVMTEECSKYGMNIFFVDYNISERDELKNVKIGRHWTLAAFLKLYIAMIVPESVEKILYLDGDMIVRHSLMELWNEDISDYTMAGVMDANQFGTGVMQTCYYDCKKYYYINTGTLLLNVKKIREHNIISKFDKFLLDHGQTLGYVDQDVFNNVLFDQKKILPTKFNAQYYSYFKPEYRVTPNEEDNISEMLKDPVIAHFTEKVKPWFACCAHPLLSDFDKYLKMSSFKGLKKSYERTTVKDIIKFILIKCGLFWKFRKI